MKGELTGGRRERLQLLVLKFVSTSSNFLNYLPFLTDNPEVGDFGRQ